MKALTDAIGIGLEGYLERYDAQAALTHYQELIGSPEISRLDALNGIGHIQLPTEDEEGCVRLDYELTNKIIVGATVKSESEMRHAERLERKIRKLGRKTLLGFVNLRTSPAHIEERRVNLAKSADEAMEKSHRMAVLSVAAGRLLEQSVSAGAEQLHDETAEFLKTTPH